MESHTIFTTPCLSVRITRSLREALRVISVTDVYDYPVGSCKQKRGAAAEHRQTYM
jgi:hypothetical protein